MINQPGRDGFSALLGEHEVAGCSGKVIGVSVDRDSVLTVLASEQEQQVMQLGVGR